MNLIPIFLFTLSSLIPSFFLSNQQNWVDLEESPNECIIETKQIKIDEYPDAFNPSIIRYKNSLLMIFRIRDPILKSTNQMGLVWLDSDFNPSSRTYLMEVRGRCFAEHSQSKSMAQDPRLINVGENLFIVYNDFSNTFYKNIRRMLVAKLQFEDDTFFIENPEMILTFDNEIRSRHEKNWAPFVYHGRLLLTYSIKPHSILRPILGENRCETVASTNTNCTWDYGELRGGTQCFVVGNEYLGFFHSTIEMKSSQSNGKKISHYFMAAYTFEKDPPFSVTKISKKPIIGKNFYNGELHKTWKPLRVVFPGGYVFDDQYIWIAYGRQDHEIWIVKIDREKLLKSLKLLD